MQRALATVALLCVLQPAVGDVPPSAQYVGSFVGTSSQRFGLVGFMNAGPPPLPPPRRSCHLRPPASPPPAGEP